MNDLFDKLNLQPHERRLVIIVGLIVFVVINFMFVWPLFGSLGVAQQKKTDAIKQLAQMRQEIASEGTLRSQRDELQSSGNYVPSFEASTVLRKTVSGQAVKSKVRLQSFAPRTMLVDSNSFFEEKGLLVRFQAGESELVDFLYTLGTNQSLIRIDEITISPDARKRTELQGRIGLVGSFQKSPREGSPTPPATTQTATTPKTSAPTPAATPKATTPPPNKTKSSPSPPAVPKKKTLTRSSKTLPPPPTPPAPMAPRTSAPAKTKTKQKSVNVPARRIPGSSN